MTTFIIRIILFIALGVALAFAGVQVLSWRGAAVWVVLLLLALLDAHDAVRMYRRGVQSGVRRAIAYLIADGWRKP